MATATVTFAYDTQKNKVLHRWLEGLPNRGRSEAIRQALASHLEQNGAVTLQDIYNAIQDLRHCGTNIAPLDDSRNIPADVLENLSGLGL